MTRRNMDTLKRRHGAQSWHRRSRRILSLLGRSSRLPRSILSPLPAVGKAGTLTKAEAHETGAQKKKKKKRKRVKDTDDRSKHDGTVFTHNRRGMEVCANWNAGMCGKSAKPQAICGHGRSNQCNLCLGPHQGMKCKNSK